MESFGPGLYVLSSTKSAQWLLGGFVQLYARTQARMLMGLGGSLPETTPRIPKARHWQHQHGRGEGGI